MKKLILTLALVASSIFSMGQSVQLKVVDSGHIKVNNIAYAIDSVSYGEYSRFGQMLFSSFYADIISEEFGHRTYFTSPMWQSYCDYLDGDNSDTPFATSEDLEAWFTARGITPYLTW